SYQIKINDGQNRTPESWLIDGQLLGRTGSTTMGMPPGLSLALNTGIISGIPTQAGSFPVTITAYEHPSGGGAQLTFTITFIIAAGASAPVITTQPSGGEVIEGVAFSFTVTASGSPAPVYQWRL